MNRKALLEAILFTTTNPMTIEEIAKVMKIRKETVATILADLERSYEREDRGIKLSNISDCKLVVKDEYVPIVSHLTPHADLSRGLLRILSIVAYKEPIRQSDIVKAVGNRTYEYVKELVKRGLIKTEKKSRTVLLSTTPHFREYFGTTERLKELHEEAQHETDDEPRNPEDG
ncbi:MAG: SMC-Scp complex subunit ScpB [Candidatus Aenigmarchaeota archaeon]|nr:SMC-Scp complex subunit ScpB [Candidatus Aenigmarchaeota archaeon]